MGAGVITLREGFEAALVVAIVLSFLESTGRRAWFRAVWLGVAAGVAVSALVAVVLFAVGAELEGRSEAIFEGTVMVIASGLVVWMVFWMRSHARTIRHELQSRVDAAVTQGSAIGVALVAFAAVVREGVESGVFLVGSLDDSRPLVALTSASLGIVAALLLGYAFYRGAERVDLRRFFHVTSVLLVLVAAWLFSGGVHELSESGVLPENEALAPLAFLALALPSLYVILLRDRVRPRPAGVPGDA
jgi:high-affinity iron transporter